MADQSLKQVGVRLVVEGQTEYASATQQAAMETQALGAATQETAAQSQAGAATSAAATTQMTGLAAGTEAASAGMAGLVTVGGGAVAFLGLLAAAVGAVALAMSTQLDPATVKLNDELDKLAHKDDTAETLGKILRISTETATMMLEAAKKDADYAEALSAVVKAAEPMPPIFAAWQEASKQLDGTFQGLMTTLMNIGDAIQRVGAGALASATATAKYIDALAQGKSLEEAWKEANAAGMAVWDAAVTAREKAAVSQETLNTLTTRAIDINAKATDSTQREAEAQYQLSQALDHTTQRMADLNTRTAQQYAAAQQNYLNTVATAHRAYAQQVEASETQLSTRLADLAQTRANDLSAIESGLANKIAAIESGLANKIADIQMGLQERAAALAHTYAQKLAQIDSEIADQRQALADKIFEIERNLRESVAALDYSTGQQLQDAKTDHDRQRILERAQFERAQLEQNANDQRSDAQRAFDEAQALADKKKALAREEYDYALRLELQQAAEQIAAAQRTAAQQVESAKRAAAEQTAAVERSYAEQTAAANRAYAQQVTNARAAEQNKLNDAQRTLNERNAAIAASYKMEVEAIQRSVAAAQEAYRHRMELLQAEYAAVIKLGQAYAQLGAGPTLRAGGGVGAGGLWSGGGDAGGASGAGASGFGAHGLDMTVPEGFYKDDFTVHASSGEHVLIEPPGATNHSSVRNVSFVINDATDPHRVAGVVREMLDNVAWGNS